MRGRWTRTLCSLALALALGWPAGATAGSASYPGPTATDRAETTPDASEQKKRKRSWGRRDKQQADKGWARSYTVDERTAKRLAEALEHLQAERYAEASAALGKLRLQRLNPFERAQFHRISAYIAFGQDDVAGAREHLEKALAEDAFPLDDQAATLYQIAQLYLAEARWSEVVQSLERWFAMVERPNSSAYYLLAISYYQLEDLDSAVEPAQQAIDIAEVPQQGWLQLLLALRLTRKEYAASIPLLEELIERYPMKIYWLQLSTVYGALGDYKEALVPLQLAYTQGLLTEEAELRRLAELLLYLDLPYRAAQVVERGVDEEQIAHTAETYELLSNSWIAAREYDEAVEPLERAAELSEAGDLYVRLAQVHIQRENWSEAATALRRALEKGGLESAGDAQLLMGIAYFSQKRPQQALTWFTRARRHPDSQDEAENWLKYVRRELQSG